MKQACMKIVLQLCFKPIVKGSLGAIRKTKSGNYSSSFSKAESKKIWNHLKDRIQVVFVLTTCNWKEMLQQSGIMCVSWTKLSRHILFNLI